jgi:hypothetical protein
MYSPHRHAHTRLVALVRARVHTSTGLEGKDAKQLWISRRGCSLTASTKIGLRIHRPDGRYVLDLSVPSDRAVALELAVLGIPPLACAHPLACAALKLLHRVAMCASRRYAASRCCAVRTIPTNKGIDCGIRQPSPRTVTAGTRLGRE